MPTWAAPPTVRRKRTELSRRNEHMASYHAAPPYRSHTAERESPSGILLVIVALFLGIAVAILTIVSVVLVKTADDARDEAKAAAGTTDHSAHSTASSGAVSLPLQSFAGTVPE